MKYEFWGLLQTGNLWWLRGFAPMPATYLRGARWEDELAAPVEQRQTNATLKGILALEKFK